MTMHILKLNYKYFDAVNNGIKTFEVRKNDRDFKLGDTLKLYEVDDEGNFIESYHKIRMIVVAVTYILTHDDFPSGVPEGYVVMSIRLMENIKG